MTETPQYLNWDRADIDWQIDDAAFRLTVPFNDNPPERYWKPISDAVYTALVGAFRFQPQVWVAVDELCIEAAQLLDTDPATVRQLTDNAVASATQGINALLDQENGRIEHWLAAANAPQ